LWAMDFVPQPILRFTAEMPRLQATLPVVQGFSPVFPAQALLETPNDNEISHQPCQQWALQWPALGGQG
jgi:hypothetical protein